MNWKHMSTKNCALMFILYIFIQRVKTNQCLLTDEWINIHVLYPHNAIL
jgi:hypothetical protein